MRKKTFCGFLLGPTGTGKTDLSFYLAEKLSTGVLNSDSISMYKGLDIGSAKPKLFPDISISNKSVCVDHSQSNKDLKANRNQHIPLFAQTSKNSKKHIPCFLFDEWEPPFIGTAGAFRKKALSVLKQEIPHHSILIVGGSGFYIQALEKGMYPIKNIKPEIKEEVKKIYKQKGGEHLYKLLVFLDPKYARTISPQDKYRVFRGVCIILSEEKPMSLIKDSFKAQKLPWPYVKVGLHLPREILFKKIQHRVEKMITEGLVEETKVLLDRGLKNWPVMNSVGYKEAVLYLQGNLSKEELKTRIVNRTMQFAKKQMSWFKRDKSIKWYLSKEKNRPQIYEFFRQFSSR